MQAREFDNLMDGKSAKFAEMFKDQPNSEGLMGALLRAQQKNASNADIETAREEIEKEEVEMPSELRAKIDSFIKQQKEKGVNDRAIRRAVQRKFEIYVI